jgi:hypothetical protein
VKASVSDSDKVSKALINWFDLMNCTRPFMKALLSQYVSSASSPGTLFRETSIHTKMISYFMQHEGTEYARTVLNDFLNEVVRHEDLSCEVKNSFLICILKALNFS